MNPADMPRGQNKSSKIVNENNFFMFMPVGLYLSSISKISASFTNLQSAHSLNGTWSFKEKFTFQSRFL